MQWWRSITAGSSGRLQPTRSRSENGWLPASVPGDVHLDLLANKKITDPFLRDNESKLQWIEKESWEYRLSFEVTPALLARSHVDLVFDGLDGAAEVSVNGVKVLVPATAFASGACPPRHICTSAKICCTSFFHRHQGCCRGGSHDPWQPKTKTEPKTYCASPPMSMAGTGVRAL
jgi:beta-mannosidase